MAGQQVDTSGMTKDGSKNLLNDLADQIAKLVLDASIDAICVLKYLPDIMQLTMTKSPHIVFRQVPALLDRVGMLSL